MGSKNLIKALGLLAFTVVFCEFLLYYLTLLRCQWPQLHNNKTYPQRNVVRMMILADTHLLGVYRGHWFDKLRREWQMYQSFQSARLLFNPDHVVILGDLFDEGLWGPDAIFESYVRRFRQLFSTPDSVKVHVVAGNHDIGFHYSIRPYHEARFIHHFNTSAVELKLLNGIPFIMINSMAMEGDDCFLCKPAKNKLATVGNILKCQQGITESCKHTPPSELKSMAYVRPIIFQHFPLYRKSDEHCLGVDSAPKEEKILAFRPKWDCLGEGESDWILQHLKPRLVLSGHTHHGCLVLHQNGIPEYSVPSFSWRNRNNPSFFLAKFSSDEMKLEKCFLPEESTVIYIYLLAVIIVIVLCLVSRRRNVICLQYRKHI